METPLSYIPRRLVRYATCSVSTEHTEQQSNRATEHSAGHVTHLSAVLAAGRDGRRRIQTFCLRPHYTDLYVALCPRKLALARFRPNIPRSLLYFLSIS